MPNTINKIIEIDSIAQKKLDDANLIKERIQKQVLEKSAQTNKLINEKADARISRILQIETQYAQDKMDIIKENNEKVIARLEKSYIDNHERLEQEIFNNVINIK